MDTKELLEMLKSEEGQLNAVFACFGSAAQKAQYFERALAGFLLDYKKLTQKDIQLHEIDSDKRTLGMLLNSFKGKAKITDQEIVMLMETAVPNRNFLMHRYFLNREDKLSSKEGRMEMLSELVRLDTHFEIAALVTNAMRHAMTASISDSGKIEELEFDFTQVKSGREFPASWIRMT
jgi:hypothetical protein